MTDATIASFCSLVLIQAVAARGLDTRALFDLAEIEPDGIEGMEERMPFEKHLLLWEAVMRLVNDPGFPIFLARRLTPADYETIGFACMTRATLGEALKQAIRYHRIWTDGSRWDLEERNGTSTVALVLDDPMRLGARCGTEHVLAEIINAGRVLTGKEWAPREVWLRHPRPRDVTAHERFFGAPVRFDRPASALVFDSSIFDQPLIKSDPRLATFFERQAEEMLARFERSSLTGVMLFRLREYLTKGVRSGLPSLESAASHLGVSTRTLRRRLQDEGTTFQDVLDQTRCELAKRYLLAERLAVGEVAFLLGFSEPSAFHRAFKRWTGQTPVTYRRSAPRASA
jgi:AraC-like DNA-binding protein